MVILISMEAVSHDTRRRLSEANLPQRSDRSIATSHVVTECPNCRHPIADCAAECARCGAPRGAIYHLPGRRAGAESVGSRPHPVDQVSVGTKALWVYAASILAATIIWVCRYGMFPLDTDGMGQIMAISASHFVIAVWFTFIPRRTGLLVAIGVIAVRTSLQWFGDVSLRLF